MLVPDKIYCIHQMHQFYEDQQSSLTVHSPVVNLRFLGPNRRKFHEIVQRTPKKSKDSAILVLFLLQTKVLPLWRTYRLTSTPLRLLDCLDYTSNVKKLRHPRK